MSTRRYLLILLGALLLPSAMQAVCPVAAVALTDGSGTKTSIPVGMNVLASAPAGWFGGNFISSNPGVASLIPHAMTLSYMATGNSPGSAGISGGNWKTEAGDTGCSLASTTLTVTALDDEVLVFDWNELINTTVGKQRTRYFEGDTDSNPPGKQQPVRYNKNRHAPIDFDHGTFQFRVTQGCQAVNDQWTWQFNTWKSDENGNPETYTNIAEPNLNFNFTGSVIGPRTFSIPLSALVTITGFDWTSTPVAQLLGHLHNPSSTNPDRLLNPAVWPMDMRFTVVNVAAGGSFSGWTNYIPNGVGDRTYDCTSPAVSITSPANNATISATTPTTISVTATDAVGITKVEFLAGPVASSRTLKWADNVSPYSWSLDPTQFTGTDLSVTAVAWDKAGNKTENSITVHKGTTPGLSVVLTANGSRGPITIDPSTIGGAPNFQQITIQPTSAMGFQEGTNMWSLHDINGDGLQDWIGVVGIDRISTTTPKSEAHLLLWYENSTTGPWIRHDIFRGPRRDIIFDPDDDTTAAALGGHSKALKIGSLYGWTFEDHIYVNRANGNDWSNPIAYKDHAGGHDVEAIDIDKDGREDFVSLDSHNTFSWLQQTANSAVWNKYDLDTTMTVAGNANTLHSGLSERGFCDLDGDNDIDVFAVGRWYENPYPTYGAAPGAQWTKHWLTSNGLAGGAPLIGQFNSQWKTYATKGWCADMDNDGDMDIVQSESDLFAVDGNGRVGWLENQGKGVFGTTVNWIKRTSTAGETFHHDLHNLGVFDYDGDGDNDVVVADSNLMENDCLDKPSTCGYDSGKSIYVMENLKGATGKPLEADWKQHRIIPGNGSGAVCHQIKVRDVDLDGKTDMVCMGHLYKASSGPDAPMIFYKNATVTGGVEMKWTITGTATSCTADTDTAGGDAIWSGAKAFSPPGTYSEMIHPTLATGNATYTLTCAPGAVASSVTINVKPDDPNPCPPDCGPDPNINYPEPPSSAALAPLYTEMNYTLPNCPTPGPTSGPGSTPSPAMTLTDAKNAVAKATGAPGNNVICIGAQISGSLALEAANTDWVTIRSASAIPNRRVKPTDTGLFGITAPTGNIKTIDVGPNAKRWRIVGLNLTTIANNHGSVVEVGLSTAAGNCELIHFDRNLIHGIAGYNVGGANKGIYVGTCKSIIAQRNYIWDIRGGAVSGFADTNAILLITSPGPAVIQNNYLESSGENLLTGGGSVYTILTDVVIRGNLFEKIVSQRGNSQFYLTKNLLEFKQGNRILVEGNIFRNYWSNEATSQRYAIVIKSTTQNPCPAPCAPNPGTEIVHSSNITIRYNKFHNFSNGFTLGKIAPDPRYLGGNTFHIHDNTFEKWGQWSTVSSGNQIVMLQITLPKPPTGANRVTADDITFENNTVVDFGITNKPNPNPGKNWASACQDNDGFCFEKGLTFRNNVIPGRISKQNALGVAVKGAEWSTYFSDSIVTKNLGIGTTNGGEAGVLTAPNWGITGAYTSAFQNYDAGNFNLAAPYNAAPYVGTDSQPLGADITALNLCVSAPVDVSPTSPDSDWDWNGTCPGIINVSVDLKSNAQSGSITIAPGTPVTNTWHVENSTNCIKCSMPATGPASWSSSAATPDGSQLISPGPTVETIYTVWCSPTAAAITCTNASATPGARSSTVNVHMNDPVCPGETKYSSPSSGSTNVSLTPTLAWRPATNAEQYDVFVGPTTTSMSLVGSNIKTQCDAPSTDKCFTVPTSAGLAYNTQYWWRIQAENTDCPTGTEGESPWSFTTLTAPDPKPDKPVYIGPANGAVDVNRPVTVSWSPAANARIYDLYGGVCTTDAECAAQPPLLETGFIGTSKTYSTLLAGTRYHWQVVAKNNNPSPTPGDIWTFTTKFDIACTPIP